MPDSISSQEWTSHSPDLTPLDYLVWDVSQKHVYAKSLKHLRTSEIFRMLSDKWHNVDISQNQKRHVTLKKTFISNDKADLYSAHLLLISW